MDIGSRIEMFVDNFLIDSMDNCKLKLNVPIRRERVLEFDKPWESETSGYITVFKDKKIIKLYYRGRTENIDGKLKEITCYAYSTDGKKFFRPNLSCCDYRGSTNNNILFRNVPECHNFTPFIDTNPTASQEQRFKAVGGHEHTGINEGTLYALYSADGIKWNRFSDKPIITDGMFDSQNVAFFDSSIGKYRCYIRYFHNSHLHNPKSYEGVRAIKSCISDDFITWSKPVENNYDVPYIEEFYTNATLRCPGAQHFYLSFPKRFMANRSRDFYSGADGVSDAVFMSSRDGINWNRTFMEAWMRPGLDRKNWVNRNNMTALGIIDSSDTEFSMYISENYKTNTNALRRLSIRKYGFASVNAGYIPGSFTTKSFTFKGHSLYINYSTSAAGHIKVKVLDEKGFVLDKSGTIYGDEIFEKVSFKNSLKQFEGKHIRLLFELKDADLFAIRFGDDTI